MNDNSFSPPDKTSGTAKSQRPAEDSADDGGSRREISRPVAASPGIRAVAQQETAA